jgi:hypothetical protein
VLPSAPVPLSAPKLSALLGTAASRAVAPTLFERTRSSTRTRIAEVELFQPLPAVLCGDLPVQDRLKQVDLPSIGPVF